MDMLQPERPDNMSVNYLSECRSRQGSNTQIICLTSASARNSESQRIDASSLIFHLMHALLCYHSTEHFMPR